MLSPPLGSGLQVSGNVDLTPTILNIAGGAGYVPPFMDGRSMTEFLTPSLHAAAAAATTRPARLAVGGHCQISSTFPFHFTVKVSHSGSGESFD